MLRPDHRVTQVRDQCSSCGELRTVARGGCSKHDERGEHNEQIMVKWFVADILKYKTKLEQSSLQWRDS